MAAAVAQFHHVHGVAVIGVGSEGNIHQLPVAGVHPFARLGGAAGETRFTGDWIPQPEGHGEVVCAVVSIKALIGPAHHGWILEGELHVDGLPWGWLGVVVRR